MSYTIFSINAENNPLRLNVFMNYLAAIPRGERMGEFIPMIGAYKGIVEHSFICVTQDFDTHIRDTIFVDGQESVLHVASGNKMEATLEYLEDGRVEALGCMHEVCREEAAQAEAWTYRPDMGCYWIAKQGNPDNALQRSMAEFQRGPLDVPADWYLEAAE